MTAARFGIEAAGGGDAGAVKDVKRFACCPRCDGTLSTGIANDPLNGNKPTRVLLHSIPFCDYYGRTSPEQIIVDVESAS